MAVDLDLQTRLRLKDSRNFLEGWDRTFPQLSFVVLELNTFEDEGAGRGDRTTVGRYRHGDRYRTALAIYLDTLRRAGAGILVVPQPRPHHYPRDNRTDPP
jgi:hypothetical protein